MQKVCLFVLALLIPAGAATAQVSSSTGPNRPAAPTVPAQLQPAAPADLNAPLAQLDRLIETTRVDLAKLRVDKWKTDSTTKRQAQDNIDSLQRNMSAALPAIETQVRTNPASVAAVFKLYRNLNALYDVLSSVTESAGAFGPRDEYQAIANDTAGLDTLRRSLADRVETMATARDAELVQLQAQVAQARQAAAAPPKKIVVDENQPTKKPVKKKKKTTAEQQ